MKAIVTVNFSLPAIDSINYNEKSSLQDFDIILFDPSFPYYSRIDFSGGGSCISIEDSESLKQSMSHWSNEIQESLKAGKNVFFLLNKYESDSMALGSVMDKKNHRTYQTTSVTNYDVLPISIRIRNSKGRKMVAVDSRFKQLVETFKDNSKYEVVIESNINEITLTNKNGNSVVGGILQVDDLPGKLILIPKLYFSEMVDYDEENEEDVWTKDAQVYTKKIVQQLIAIDDALQLNVQRTPKPDWIDNVELPEQVRLIDGKIRNDESEIEQIELQIEKLKIEKQNFESYTALLFENGELLEQAIESSLELMGYQSENFQDGDLEIDHIIVGPSGIRMIGESEGKDSSAIDIKKFRQLESNIGEDFEREEVEAPAKGVLFGNGYRLKKPKDRDDQFTKKCITNAKRLRTALVRTMDLYDVVLYLLKNPTDESYKKKCRDVLEETQGKIVNFPTVPDPKTSGAEAKGK